MEDNTASHADGKPKRFLYIFLDEAGDFDFSPGGSKYFIMASVTRERPFGDYSNFVDLKYGLVEQGMDIEYFHASEDRQAVRDQVFDIIQRNLTGMRIDAVIVEKRKTGPALREEARFYPRILGYLLRYVLERHALEDYAEVIVFTDRIPVKGKRRPSRRRLRRFCQTCSPKRHDIASCITTQNRTSNYK